MKKYSSRILIGVVAILMVFSIYYDVEAKTQKEEWEEDYKKFKNSECDSKVMKPYFGLKLKKEDKNKYKIVSLYNENRKKKVQYQIVSVIGSSSTNYVGQTFTNNKVVKIKTDKTGLMEIKVVVSGGSLDKFAKKCKVKKTKATLRRYYYGDKFETAVESSVLRKGEIAAAKKQMQQDIDPNFSAYKREAFSAGNDYSKKSLNKTLSCNSNSSKYNYVNDKKKEAYTPDSSKYHYSNTNYYYASKPEDDKEVKITLKYSNGRKSKKLTVCKKHCEEAVKVEYGPPVASKAGLCFQYRFKVTSYVQCSATPIDNPPQESDYKTCTPPPECYNVNLGLLRQGGPNDEYQDCVRKCDGGKYSRKCSNKCYKKVYGNNSSSTNTNYRVDSSSVLRTGADQGKKCEYDNDGCYYWTNKGNIHWVEKSTNRGRWYREWEKRNGRKYNPKEKFPGTYFLTDGIYKEQSCNDSCSWDTDKCNWGGKQGINRDYLNPGQAKHDAKEHAKQYLSALKNECKALTTCSSSSSEYTITINPPNETPKDFGPSKLVSPKGSGNNDDSKIIISPNTDYESTNNSCYSPRNSGKHWYQSEWTFPGSYINAKTGELSYNAKYKGADGWIPKDKKYCLPLNTKEVNEQWWVWDQIAYAKYKQDYKGSTPTNNITGMTQKFGYYGWKFIMKCFFAVVNTEIKDDEVTSNPPYFNTDAKKVSTGLNNFDVRVVDTAKLFASRTSDKIGFNWTNASNMKGLNMREMIDNIQNKKIYSQNPDYKFHLTKEVLADIRKFSDDKDGYTDYRGTIEKVSGSKYKLWRYHTELITRYASSPRLSWDAPINQYTSYK